MSEEPTTRAARLRAQSEDLIAQSNRRADARDWARRKATEITGTASTVDGDVAATVDHTGTLTHLTLSQRTRQIPPEDLARAITMVIRQATANARNQVRDVYVSLQNEGVIRDLPPFLPAAPD